MESPPRQHARALQNTLDDFRAWLSQAQDADFASASFEDLRKALLDIQDDQDRRRTMMNLTRIGPYLVALDTLDAALASFLPPDVARSLMAFVWGPTRWLVATASAEDYAFDLLLDLYQRLGTEMGFLRKIFRPCWHDLTDVFDALVRAASVQTELAEFLTLQHDRGATQNLSEIQEYTRRRAVFLADLERTKAAKQGNQKAIVSRWIQASSRNRDLHDHYQSERRAWPGCGGWLLNHSLVHSWMRTDDASGSRVWLDGEPGIGKTMLASALIDSCASLKGSGAIPPDSEVYYFYCQGTDPGSDTGLGFAKVMVSQLLAYQQDLLPVFIDAAKTSGQVTLTSTDRARELLSLGLETERRQYFIVDGLDACEFPRARNIISTLNQILRDKSLLPGDVVATQIRPDDVQDDIGRFARISLLSLQPRISALSEVDIGYIQRKVVQQSRGNFLRARLIVETLLLQPTKDDLLRAVSYTASAGSVRDLCSKIAETINDGLRLKSNGHVVIANTLVSWFGGAKRPLVWHEMESICRLHWAPESSGHSPRNILLEVLEAYRPVLRVTASREVLWVHETARHYITSADQQAQFNLAIFCLLYLSGPTFSPDCSMDVRDKEARRGNLALQDYAAAHWADHVEDLLGNHQTVFRQQHYEAAFSNVLKAFVSSHRHSLDGDPAAREAAARCVSFSEYSFYEELCLLYRHVFRYRHGDAPDPSLPLGIASISQALELNRTAIEKLTTSPSQDDRDAAAAHYGTLIFKCKIPTCPAFLEGFPVEIERAAHLNRHDRPFPCPLDRCTQAPFGFTSKKDQERHIRHYHPEHSDQPPAFVQPTRRIEDARFVCDICGKAFTRNINLKGHMRSHFGDRPYACSSCGKAFTRLNDCRRHEKIHEKKG
ncbi:hypothetical protein F5X68DRAFT_175816 [Plectosphaerella plurivora]|uniref:C2H2-type domain-containing protein n=1 Tax=Plectosphaerella plurivora TaxID=936078 RepID=A0A9P8V3Y5_9PEZI|nr:hypothetical protein F5X68DRAFT_175816 [Plectosphaerella plurivora]